MVNASRTSSSGHGARASRWPFTVATIGLLPLWWGVHTLIDQTPRLVRPTADVWFGFLVMLQPWLIH